MALGLVVLTWTHRRVGFISADEALCSLLLVDQHWRAADSLCVKPTLVSCCQIKSKAEVACTFSGWCCIVECFLHSLRNLSLFIINREMIWISVATSDNVLNWDRWLTPLLYNVGFKKFFFRCQISRSHRVFWWLLLVQLLLYMWNWNHFYLHCCGIFACFIIFDRPNLCKVILGYWLSVQSGLEPRKWKKGQISIIGSAKQEVMHFIFHPEQKM